MILDMTQLAKAFPFERLLQAIGYMSDAQEVCSPTSGSLLGKLEMGELTTWTSFTCCMNCENHLKGSSILQGALPLPWQFSSQVNSEGI